MSPEHLQEVLDLCGALAPTKGGLRELPEKTTMTIYAATDAVGLTIQSVDAVTVKGQLVHARTTKGETYFVALEHLFAASIDGRNETRGGGRRAGFA